MSKYFLKMNKLNWNKISLVLAFAFMIFTFSCLFYYVPPIGFILLFCIAMAYSITRLATYFVEGY